jgi:hypothetical protein
VFVYIGVYTPRASPLQWFEKVIHTLNFINDEAHRRATE